MFGLLRGWRWGGRGDVVSFGVAKGSGKATATVSPGRTETGTFEQARFSVQVEKNGSFSSWSGTWVNVDAVIQADPDQAPSAASAGVQITASNQRTGLTKTFEFKAGCSVRSNPEGASSGDPTVEAKPRCFYQRAEAPENTLTVSRLTHLEGQHWPTGVPIEVRYVDQVTVTYQDGTSDTAQPYRSLAQTAASTFHNSVGQLDPIQAAQLRLASAGSRTVAPGKKIQKVEVEELDTLTAQGTGVQRKVNSTSPCAPAPDL